MKEEIKSYNHNFRTPYRIYSCVNLKFPKTTIIKKHGTKKGSGKEWKKNIQENLK